MEEGKEKIEIEKPPELGKTADSEVAAFLVRHIENPCEAEVAPGVKKNIRGFYIREAKRILPNMTNPFATDLLKSIISQYKEEEKQI